MIARLFLFLCLALACRAGAQGCTGDCDGDFRVTVDEVVTAVVIALGNRPVEDCMAADGGNDGTVTVDEVIKAVNHALDGCPPSVATLTATPTFTAVATATATLTAAATATPTATSTASPSPPASLTPTGTASIRLDLGRATGPPGTQVSLELTLIGSAGLVVSASSDITYDATQLAVVRDGGIGCALAFSDPPGSGVERLLLLNVLPASGSRERLRIGIVNSIASRFPDTPLPDGPLVRCDFAIDPAASAGEKILANVPDVAGADDLSLPVAGSDGVVTVLR